MHEDGSVDNTFEVDENVEFSGRIQVDSIGRLVFASESMLGSTTLLRLDSNGSLDENFKVPTSSRYWGRQNDRVFFHHGTFLNRSLDDGSLDPKFRSTLIAQGFTNMNTAVDGKNRIIIRQFPRKLLRLAPLGGADPLTHEINLARTPSGFWVSPQTNEIYTWGGGEVRRYFENGERDFGYESPSLPAGSSVRFATDGSVFILGGQIYGGGLYFARILPEGGIAGRPQPGYNRFSNPFPAGIRSVHVLGSGQILTSGRFDVVSGTISEYFAKLNQDGSRNDGFVPDEVDIPEKFSSKNLGVRSMLPLKDGRILAIGGFSNFRPYGRRMIRLHQSGEVDTTFRDPNLGNLNFEDASTNRLLEFENYYLVARDYNGIQGINKLGPAKVFKNGAVSQSFILEAPVIAEKIEVRDMTKTTGDKIITVGKFRFLSPNGFDNRSLAFRSEFNGDLDSSFFFIGEPNLDFQRVLALPDGRIVGALYDSTTDTTLIRRFLSNGAVDPTFEEVFVEGVVRALEELPSGKIAVGGKFVAANGVERSNLLLVNYDGSLNPYDVPLQTQVNDFGLEKNGDLLVGAERLNIDAPRKPFENRLLIRLKNPDKHSAQKN